MKLARICFVLLVCWSRTGAAKTINVVLVHGIWNDGRVFAPMEKELSKHGCRCFAPDLHPNDGTSGIADLTQKLSARIDAHFGRRAPFYLVGFSMGGLVARNYAEHTLQGRRVRGVFLISTPSGGTLWADLSTNARQRELAPGSAFLRALNTKDSGRSAVLVHSYWTPFDLMIVPSFNCAWPRESSVRVLCLLHPWMVRNHFVISDISARLSRSHPFQ